MDVPIPSWWPATFWQHVFFVAMVTVVADLLCGIALLLSEEGGAVLWFVVKFPATIIFSILVFGSVFLQNGFWTGTLFLFSGPFLVASVLGVVHLVWNLATVVFGIPQRSSLTEERESNA